MRQIPTLSRSQSSCRYLLPLRQHEIQFGLNPGYSLLEERAYPPLRLWSLLVLSHSGRNK